MMVEARRIEGYLPTDATEIQIRVRRYADKSETRERNKGIIQRLLELQQREQHACVPTGLAQLAAYYYPKAPLPEIEEYLKRWSQLSSELLSQESLGRGKLLVWNGKIEEVLSRVFPQYGIEVEKMTLTNRGGKLIGGEEYKSKWLPKTNLPVKITDEQISIDEQTLPCAFVVNQAGSCSTHFAVLDGSKEATQILEDEYINKLGYRVVGKIQFRPSCK